MIWRTTSRGAETGAALGHGAGRRLPAILLLAVALIAALMVSLGAGSTASGKAQAVAETSVAAPQTIRKSIWGQTDLNGVSLLPTYKEAGIGNFELQLRWYETATTQPANPTDPNDPAYQWPAHLDKAIADAAANGMQVTLAIIGTPPWANSGRSWQWAPNNPQDFANFATAAAKRYPNVHLWMIWIEANLKQNFRPFVAAKTVDGPLKGKQATTPRKYAQLLDAAYGALKAASPANLVIGGDTYSGSGSGDINPLQWIRALKLPGGKRPRMDMYGHNPPSFKKPSFKAKPSPKGIIEFSDLKRLTRELDKNFRGKKLKLFLSEWGIAVGFGTKRVSDTKAASFIRAGLRLVQNFPRIYTVGWVVGLDRFENQTTQLGLLDAQGNPKPEFFAFQSGLN